MARKTQTEKSRSIHNMALREFDNIQITLREERKQSLKDRRFYSIAGAQWEDELGDQFENKPKFEVNKVHLAVIRIINEYRNNRITVRFIPKNGKDDKFADACNGLYRANEQDSQADEAYDNAFEEAVGGGFGAWRLRAEYEDEDDDENEEQRICIEPIYDADSCVFFDLNAKRQDKSDARSCYVLTAMSPEAYEDEYGKNPVSLSKEIQDVEFDWATPDVVYVAEYYKVEKVRETVYIYKGVDGSEKRLRKSEIEEDPEQLDILYATGFREDRTKEIRIRKVHKYIMDGQEILEDCGYIAGQNIPIVPVYGKRWFVDNVERCMGHVRLAKDAQRLKNMQISKLGELAGQTSVEKPIFTPEQISGHQVMWEQDNIKNYPYLLINTLMDMNGQEMAAGPIAYTKTPVVPPAMAALLQVTEQDIQDLLGNQQEGEEVHPNLSGVAVELIQNKLDMQTFIYMSNMAKAVKRSGEIWLGMAKDIFVEEGREMKTMSESGDIGAVQLMKPTMDKKTFASGYENDFSQANYEVFVEVGPSSMSRRNSTVKSLTSLMQISSDPETLQVLSAMVMMNMEGEGISEVRNYFRKKLLRIGAVEPTEEEAEELKNEAVNTPPDPQVEYLRKAGDKEEAQAEEARVKTVKTASEAGKTQAEILEILAGIDRADLEQALEAARTMKDLRQAQGKDFTNEV